MGLIVFFPAESFIKETELKKNMRAHIQNKQMTF